MPQLDLRHLVFINIYTVFQTYLLVCVQCSSEFCVTVDDEIKCGTQDDIRLTRIDGKLMGIVQEIADENGRDLHMKTVSLKPLVLEIPNFLTPEECNFFRNVAKDQGLRDSMTVSPNEKAKTFQLMDRNHDKQLDVNEMRITIEHGFDTFLDNDDIMKMYDEIGLDKNKDGLITPDELKNFHPRDLKKYVNEVLKKQPEKHSRMSKQVWLYPEKSTESTFDAVQKRVSKIFNLPFELLKLSDFQVVSYDVKGHYNAHHDSTTHKVKAPCCTKNSGEKCRICRYMTVLFYLNDVEEGGETAFPYANNETLNFQEVESQSKHNLYRNCEEANLRVSPEEGKAVIWYNHFINDENGWLGEMDESTYHGGCPVIKGNKWIANFWIKVTDDKLKDLGKMQKVHHSILMQQSVLTKNEL